MMVSDRTLVAILCGFGCSLILTKIIQIGAVQRNLLDKPNERSSHIVPVPRVGGIAIVIATILGCAIAVKGITGEVAAVAFGSLVLATSGLLDDLKPLGALPKCAPQAGAAAVVAIVTSPEFHISLPFVSVTIIGLPAFIIAMIWLVTITNAYNFMDGIDGITAGVGIITALTLAVTIGGTTIVLPLVAALAGFLAWNCSPASIFMGDVGSQFIGFLLGASVLLGANKSIEAIPAIIIFMPYLFDTGLTILRRIKDHEHVFAAHRSHLYQRLNIVGFDHRTVANTYYGATACSALIAIAYKSSGSLLQLLLITLGVGLLFAYARTVFRLEQKVLKRCPNIELVNA